MTTTPDVGRCPTCGEGTLVDISFDLDPSDPAADSMQEADSRQIETYSCGHTVVGPRLSSADQEAMTVERRTSDETTMPEPGVSTPDGPDGGSAPDPADDQDELVDEASEESFPASDPPSYWAREAPDTI